MDIFDSLLTAETGPGRKVRSVAGFFCNHSGSALVEFAIVAPLFFGTLLSIFEVGIMFADSVMLETAAKNGAREVRTGAIYEATADVAAQETMFADAMCRELILLDCGDISYDVRRFTDFGSVTGGVTFASDGTIQTPNFNIGEPKEVIVITLAYQYTFVVPYIGRLWGQDGLDAANSRMLRSTFVFMNEPFPTRVP